MLSEPGLLCADGFRQTGFITEPFCIRCGGPFAAAASARPDRLCPGCRAEPPVFERARAGAALLGEADVLVPLHRSRLFHRRYNQAALPPQAAGRIAGRPWLLDARVRQRATESLDEGRRPNS